MIASALLAACGGPGQDRDAAQAGGDEAVREDPAAGQDAAPRAGSDDPEAADEEFSEILPGLSMRVLKAGSGETAEPGQMAVVHYTGWLHDPSAPDNRGTKFDSSVDRGQPFEFPLGAGAVIKGWDEGVTGMQIGEVRELTIAPELAYGPRGAGDVIPPNATLVFQVELLDLEGDESGGA